jgi:hypothetical protein
MANRKIGPHVKSIEELTERNQSVVCLNLQTGIAFLALEPPFLCGLRVSSSSNLRSLMMYSSKNYTDLLEGLTAPPLSPLSRSRGFVPAQMNPEPPVRDLGRDSRGPAGRVSAVSPPIQVSVCRPSKGGSFPFPFPFPFTHGEGQPEGREAAYLKAKCEGPEVIN